MQMPDESRYPQPSEPHGIPKQASDLFRYLHALQKLQQVTVRDSARYRARGGRVDYLDSLNGGRAVSRTNPTSDTAIDAPILTVLRLQPTDHPEVPDVLAGYLNGDPANPVDEPSLAFPDPLNLPEDAPAAESAYRSWVTQWRDWAAREREDARGRELYADLFSIRDQLAVAPQDWEFLLGIGRLQIPVPNDRVDRHLIVVPLRMDLDPDSGSISLRLADGAEAKAEFDMLSSDELLDASAASDLERAVGELPVSHPLEPEQWRVPLQHFIHRGMSAGEFLDEPWSASSVPQLSLSPAIILRRRSLSGMLRALDVIANELASLEDIPSGIRALVDPDAVDVDPASDTPHQGGAAFTCDGEYYLPLPVNSEQLQVLGRADSRPLTVVQGPPGTGKTHTTAVLISHFLTQGKRVLVTAQTQQALREVRDKLPDEIKELAVSVLGNDRQEMANLRASINAISQRAQTFSSAENDAAIRVAEQEIDGLSRRRAELRNQLIEEASEECAPRDTPFGQGRLAEVARRILAEEQDIPWATEVLPEATLDKQAPDPAAVMEFAQRTARWDQSQLVEEAAALPPGGVDLPDVTEVLDLLDRVTRGRQVREKDAGRAVDPRFTRMLHDTSTVEEVRTAVGDLLAARASLGTRPEAWVAGAIADIRVGKSQQWISRYNNVQGKLNQAQQLQPAATSQGVITIAASTVELRPLVGPLLEFTANGEIKLDNQGLPKTGLMAARQVRAGRPLFEAVRIAGRPPSTHADFQALDAHLRLSDLLHELDQSWPAGTDVSVEDSAAERLAWHSDELAVLGQVLGLLNSAQRVHDVYHRHGLGPADTGDDQALAAIGSQLDVLAHRLDVAATEREMNDLASSLLTSGRNAPSIARVAQSVRECDQQSFLQAHRHAVAVVEEQRSNDRRLELRAALIQDHPRLVAEVEADPSDEKWAARMRELVAAWKLSAARNWVDARDRFDPNAAQAEIAQIDMHIRMAVSELVGRRSWAQAVGRLTPSRKADLQYYAQLVKSYGKGTGKRAGRLQPEIRKALANSRDAVPVWIMPLHQVADSQEIAMNTFDVVVVDEASQAGLESLFLQFLAPKMVVVGDDKQVSPSAVGVQVDEVEALANRYLSGNRYKAAFADPGRSLFDEAKMRYPDVITLREHRRCVPDIIGFSNEVAYAPDGVPLIPVREPGASALEPVLTRFCSDGYLEGAGTAAPRNPVEAKAIVETILEMLGDPRYEGKTIGVISLLGPQQAKLIERQLLASVSPEEMVAREIRCGDSASFQGAERDVMLLSLVAAPTDGRRLTALTKDTFVQRYNVAASRAKDQMILFYSTPVELLRNEEDMRFRLVEYCERVAANQGAGIPGAFVHPVAEDRLQPPFESLFEQRICNALAARGFIVVPQYESLGYRIDLVVVGANGKLAVECDGDHWHGPERFGADLARQRDLERCGWTFYRVLESDFILDPAAALDPLFALLSARGILPGARVPEPALDPHSPPEPARLVADDDEVAEPDQQESGPDPLGSVDEAPDQASTLFGDESNDIPPRSESRDGDPKDTSRVIRESPEPQGVRWRSGGSFGGLRLMLEEYEEAELSPLPKDFIEHRQMRSALREVVAVEGPLIGSRLIRVVHRARGHQRLKKPSDQPYLAVVQEMVDDGDLLCAGDDTETATYWLPGQLEIRLRTLGPRRIEEIPPHELASVVAKCRARYPHPDGEDGYVRATLRTYGLVRMTDKVFRYITEIERDYRDPRAHMELT